MSLSTAIQRIEHANGENLSHLSLSNMELNDVDLKILLPSILKLKNLISLNLTGNNLSNVNFLQNLTNLVLLYLGNNNISNVDFIRNLTNLSSLSLRENNLSNLDFLQNFNKLSFLGLQGNPILEKRIGKVIENTDNPQAIIKAYFDWKEAERKKNLTPLNEARIMLVGEGRVGKSSLRISLLEGKCVEQQKQTEGLEVVEWDLQIPEENRNVKFNVWDFGGQEIYHTTHQYFFNSECLYILVADYSGRVHPRTNRISYWLTTIQMLAKKDNSDKKPVVIIVGNKMDEQPDNKVLDEKITNEIEKLRTKYTDLDIAAFVPVSCLKGENIYQAKTPENKSLVQVIKQQLDKIGVNRQIPKTYFDYKKIITDSGKDFIKVEEFADFCPEDSEIMLSIFHYTGIVTAFGENKKIRSKELKNLIVFKHEWITKGIYKILSANHLLEINKGIATKEELSGLLDIKTYPSLDDIIEMMKEFYICRSKFADDSKGNQTEKFFFPKFFSNKANASVKNYKANSNEKRIDYQYDYSFISANIIAFFIIKASEKFSDNDPDFWRDGGFIYEKEGSALVEADEEENSITIIVKGINAENLLHRIRHIFDEIHQMDFIPKPKWQGEVARKQADKRQNEIDNLTINDNKGTIIINKDINGSEIDNQIKTKGNS